MAGLASCLSGSDYYAIQAGSGKISKRSSVVMAGLDPAIYVSPTAWISANEGVDHRGKPGDDNRKWTMIASVATELAGPETSEITAGHDD